MTIVTVINQCNSEEQKIMGVAGMADEKTGSTCVILRKAPILLTKWALKQLAWLFVCWFGARSQEDRRLFGSTV